MVERGEQIEKHGVIFALWDGEKIQLEERKKIGGKFFGYILVPGGAVEEGETLKEALFREVGEEYGVKALSYRKIGIYPNIEDNGILNVRHLYLVTKCIVQLPFSKYVDSHDDKVKWLMIGTFLIGMVPFIYIFARSISFIYVAQVIYGIGSGLAFPTWLGLWTSHLDKKHESFEWSLYSTLTGLGTAVTASIGAVIAQYIGFIYTFALVGIMSLIGCFILFGLEKKKDKLDRINISHYHKIIKMGYKRHH